MSRPAFFSLLLSSVFVCLTLSSCETVDKVGGVAKSAVGKLGNLWPLGDKDKDKKSTEKDAKDKDKDKEGSAGPMKPREQIIGHVHLVHASSQFVLIKQLLRVDMRSGTELICKRSNGTPSAKLKLSPEMKERYLVADIVNGLPTEGDFVVLYGFVDAAGNFSATPRAQDSGVQVLE